MRNTSLDFKDCRMYNKGRFGAFLLPLLPLQPRFLKESFVHTLYFFYFLFAHWSKQMTLARVSDLLPSMLQTMLNITQMQWIESIDCMLTFPMMWAKVFKRDNCESQKLNMKNSHNYLNARIAKILSHLFHMHFLF